MYKEYNKSNKTKAKMMMLRNVDKSELNLERHDFSKFCKENTPKKFEYKTMQLHSSGK